MQRNTKQTRGKSATTILIDDSYNGCVNALLDLGKYEDTGYTPEQIERLNDIAADVEQLRNIVWSVDIPSPTVPEYVEHHENIQKILAFIDNMLKKPEKD